jgi:hypothetical protein
MGIQIGVQDLCIRPDKAYPEAGISPLLTHTAYVDQCPADLLQDIGRRQILILLHAVTGLLVAFAKRIHKRLQVIHSKILHVTMNCRTKVTFFLKTPSPA